MACLFLLATPLLAQGQGQGCHTLTVRNGHSRDAGLAMGCGDEGTAGQVTSARFTVAAGVAGACGSAEGRPATLTPASGLCSAGTAGAVGGDAGAWHWSCADPDGGAPAACQAPVGYSKISNAGQAQPVSAALGSGPEDWGCTRDGLTGLVWEVKTTSGLRGQLQKFTWFDSDPATNGGANGVESGGSCHASGRCDTEKYVQDVNAAGLCGATDWRMPTRAELRGLLDTRQATRPEINHDFFPNTPPASVAWSGTPLASDARFSHCLSFNGQGELICNRQNSYHVRLVRAGQALAPALAGETLEGATLHGATVRATSDQPATGWWLVVPRSSAAPTPAQVKAQAAYGGVVPVARGSAAMPAATAASFVVAALTPGTEYDFYLVAEASGQLSAPVRKVAFVTAAPAVAGACGSAHGGATLAPPPLGGLCSAGTWGGYTASSTGWAWKCNGTNGGAQAQCGAPRQYLVSVEVAGGGTASPAASQAVAYGQAAQFTLAPDAGQAIAAASGCGGALAGAVFTTAAVQANCKVSVRFAPPALDGTCGAAAGRAGITPPTAGLCNAGQPGSLQSLSGQYTWRCEGAQGGAAAICAAPWATASETDVRASLDLPAAAHNNGWRLVDAGIDAALPAPLPPGAHSAFRPLRLVLGGGTAAQAQATVHYSAPVPEGAVYLKYGPSPEGLNCTGPACRQPHWYTLPGARFSPDRLSVRLPLTDGGAGDGDGVADGRITDPGMPALLAAAPGGAQAIPTVGAWGLLLLSALLSLAGLCLMRIKSASGA